MSIQSSYNDPIHFTPYFQSQGTAFKSSDPSGKQQFLAELESASGSSAGQTESDSDSGQTSGADSPETLPGDPSLILPYFQSLSATHQPCDPSVTQQFLAELESIVGSSIGQTESDPDSGQTSGTDSPETLPGDPSLILPYFESASATHQPCDPSVTQQLLAALESTVGSSTGEAGGDTT
jgi:hypothetical protein